MIQVKVRFEAAVINITKEDYIKMSEKLGYFFSTEKIKVASYGCYYFSEIERPSINEINGYTEIKIFNKWIINISPEKYINSERFEFFPPEEIFLEFYQFEKEYEKMVKKHLQATIKPLDDGTFYVLIEINNEFFKELEKFIIDNLI